MRTSPLSYGQQQHFPNGKVRQRVNPLFFKQPQQFPQISNPNAQAAQVSTTDLAEMRKMLSTLGVHTQALPSFDMSKFPSVWLPLGFKYPKMSKFDGATNPHSHIMRFQMKATPYYHDVGLLIHLFFYSLERESMEWFMSLSKEELSSFK